MPDDSLAIFIHAVYAPPSLLTFHTESLFCMPEFSLSLPIPLWFPSRVPGRPSAKLELRVRRLAEIRPALLAHQVNVASPEPSLGSKWEWASLAPFGMEWNTVYGWRSSKELEVVYNFWSLQYYFQNKSLNTPQAIMLWTGDISASWTFWERKNVTSFSPWICWQTASITITSIPSLCTHTS